MDEGPLQRRIYFLTFIDSLHMIFSQNRETCEVLLDYTKIGGDDVIVLFIRVIVIRLKSKEKRSPQRRKNVVSIGEMTRPTHLQAMILFRAMTVIIDVSDANIRNIRKRIR